MKRMRVNSVEYRQGFVEVARVHPGCVNLEIWEILAGTDISGADLADVPDEHVVANVEIELGRDDVRTLIGYLRDALDEEAEDERGTS
jgi:hypothetical protein